MNKTLSAIILSILSLTFYRADGSHIVGGEVTYQFLYDSIGAGTHLNYYMYKVNVIIYEDCLNGQPLAIQEDNPAWVSVYYGNGAVFELDTGDNPNGKGIQFASSISVPANFSNACITKIPATCLLKKTFTKIYTLPASSSGYVVSYQRCCRNGATVNIMDPANNGATYYCTIPPTPFANSSAIFNNYPPQIICLNNPLYYDHSAFDPDHDSLSYEFCPACTGADQTDIKPTPAPPDQLPPLYYDSVSYLPGFSSKNPLTSNPRIQIDPHTGLITGTPNRVGRFLVTVCCHEWRDGIMINTVKREFQFVVTPCTKVVVADIPQYSTDPNTYIVNCNDYTVRFQNTSKGGFTYHWDFGVPGAPQDSSDEFEPTFTYPDTGTFTVELMVNPRSTCSDSISRFVKVYPKFRADFADSGAQCTGAPVHFRDLSTSTLKPITYWKWMFGDGETSIEENPEHTYLSPGLYNVTLISENIRSCIDTAFSQVVIDNFTPFAGNDTSIVKGESIHFNATGGVRFTWTPSSNLSDTSIHNPIGYYPDTGRYTYYVQVVSAYGCSGTDSIKVDVVNQAAFVVPTAFTPNGDGLNDIFRPLAVGYKNLNYFRIFNRWGDEVYFSTTLEVGWNGYYKNKEAEMGTYFWEISFNDRFGKKGFMKGDVQLLR